MCVCLCLLSEDAGDQTLEVTHHGGGHANWPKGHWQLKEFLYLVSN